MKESKPNIFSLGTTELTQDAFIAWLCSWAKPEYDETDTKLHNVGVQLLNKFFELHGIGVPPIKSVEVLAQWKKIDVLVCINQQYWVIIEDKVFSSEHSDQLNRYKELLIENKNLNSEQVLPIYFKTGDQADFRKQNEAGYKVFDRQSFLKILESGIEKGIRNDIYREYYDHLNELEHSVEAFRSISPAKWDRNQWIGFFKFLNKEFGVTEHWGYVSNPSGGFMGYWFNRKSDIDGHDLYLQIEGPRLCFKIATYPDARKVETNVRWEWLQRVEKIGQQLGCPITKPNRLAPGKWVTFAEWKESDSQETWIPTTKNGLPDFQRAVEIIQKAKEILDRSVSQALKKK